MYDGTVERTLSKLTSMRARAAYLTAGGKLLLVTVVCYHDNWFTPLSVPLYHCHSHSLSNVFSSAFYLTSFWNHLSLFLVSHNVMLCSTQPVAAASIFSLVQDLQHIAVTELVPFLFVLPSHQYGMFGAVAVLLACTGRYVLMMRGDDRVEEQVETNKVEEDISREEAIGRKGQCMTYSLIVGAAAGVGCLVLPQFASQAPSLSIYFNLVLIPMMLM